MIEEKIEDLSNEIAQLKDLFVRRLFEDKNTKIAVETLTNQNEILNNKLFERDMDSIAKELVLVCDRIEANCDNSDFAYSVREEITEIFARRDIFRIEINEMEKFNPKYHKAVKRVIADENYPHGIIVSVIRNGYMSGNRVLRPAEVVVAYDNKLI